MPRSRKRKKNPKKKTKKDQVYSGLSRHTRKGSQLLPPLAELPMKVLEWERDLLPEYLWITSLVIEYPQAPWEALYKAFMDAIDPFFPTDNMPLGLITDFGLVPESRREEFCSTHKDLVFEAFHKPFGRIIAFYPESPAYWLANQARITDEGPLDPNVELRRLQGIVLKLFPGKDSDAGHIRAVPLARFFKHNKIKIFRTLKVVDLIPKYPNGCTEEEKFEVQAFARSTIHMRYAQEDYYKDRAWPKYFWRHNYDLVPCKPHRTKTPTKKYPRRG